MKKQKLNQLSWNQYHTEQIGVTTHSKIGGLFMFQKVLIKMLPAHVYLPFENGSYVPLWIIYEF